MLPIYDQQSRIVSALANGNRLILQAPTGSGKSTQAPQMILDAGMVEAGRELTVMQPRRLAVRMLARRVASERRAALGGEVGYQVRLDRKAGPDTRIRYVTEGILLREWLRAPRLEHVGCLLFDEFHERHLYGDLSLAHALKLQATSRPDLRIVLMSATLDTESLQVFLPDAELVTSAGRTYPVDISYLNRDPTSTGTPIWEAAATATDRLASLTDGDILVFMPGRFTIDRTLDALKRTPAGKSMRCLPLHGDLPPQEQDRAVSPSSERKIIVSTNIAETSLTIEGVCGVVDSGLARVARFDPVRGADQLNVEPVSKTSADQRAGRAGRTAPGQCVRLWTKAGHAKRPRRDTPEIHRVDLAEAVLILRALGVDDWSTLALPDPPEPSVLASTEGMLRDLGALDRQGAITDMGRKLVEYPAHPRVGRLMLEAETRGVAESAALIAGLLQGRPLFVRKVAASARREQLKLFSGDGSSDFLMQLRACEWAAAVRFDRSKCGELGIHAVAARQAVQTAGQFRSIGRRRATSETGKDRSTELRKCLAVAFADHLGLRRPDTRRCDLVDGRVAELDRDTVCTEAELVVASEIRNPERSKIPFLTGVTRIESEWLADLFPDLFESRTETRYDEQAKRVLVENKTVFGKLVLKSKLTHEVGDDAAGRLLADAVEAGTVPMPNWDAEVDDWITRLNILAAAQPEWGLFPITPGDRRLLLEHMLAGCRTRKDVKTLEVQNHIRAWLAPAQRKLVDERMPDRVVLPNGKRARIRYEEGSPPVVSSKLQNFFGLREAPAVAAGALKCRAELLAPNQRPAALTDDLASFWENGYPMVRKDLKGRYPKHDWPETPP